MGRAVKNSLEIIIKQVRLEGGFERGGRIRVAECLRQIVPDRWASIRKRKKKSGLFGIGSVTLTVHDIITTGTTRIHFYTQSSQRHGQLLAKFSWLLLIVFIRKRGTLFYFIKKNLFTSPS